MSDHTRELRETFALIRQDVGMGDEAPIEEIYNALGNGPMMRSQIMQIQCAPRWTIGEYMQRDDVGTCLDAMYLEGLIEYHEPSRTWRRTD